MISKGEFELIDDVLCGVDNNPRRVKIARASVHRAMAEIEVYKDFTKAIAEDLEEIKGTVAYAGLCFLCGDPKSGHKEMHDIMGRLETIARDANERIR